MDMTGKTVVITGASRGIGAAAARAFADAGTRVVLLARSSDDIDKLSDEIGDQAMSVPCDVSSYHEVDRAIEQVVARFGGVDVLINNAGVIEPIARLGEADPAAWSHVIDVNLKGVFYGMHAALPHLRASGGTVLTISSGAAHNALEGWSHYCASKAGVDMMTQALHKEEGPQVRALGLSPGTVATEMQREIKASGINPVAALEWEDHIPPEWPAKALLWMCTPEADEYLGREVSLRDETIRQKVGLSA